FQAEDGIRDFHVTGVQTCALPICSQAPPPPEPDEAALAEAVKQPEFKRFVEAQLTWDRAMAEALAGAKRKFSNAAIVGVLGSGRSEERRVGKVWRWGMGRGRCRER